MTDSSVFCVLQKDWFAKRKKFKRPAQRLFDAEKIRYTHTHTQLGPRRRHLIFTPSYESGQWPQTVNLVSVMELKGESPRL